MSSEVGKKKRDDFTWLLLWLTSGKQKTVPLKNGHYSAKRGPYSYPTNYRFKDDNAIMEEQQKRLRRAQWVGLGYIFVTIAVLLVLSLLLH